MKKRNIYLIYLILLSSSVVMSQSRNGLYLEKYQLGSGLKFNSYSNEYEFKISGVVQTTYELKGLTDFEEFNSRFRVRRARLAVEGKIRRAKLSWRIKTDFGLPFGNSNEELNNGALLDAFITYQPIPQVKITVGQRSLFSDNRELRMSSTGLSFVERSRVTSAMAAIRDFGLFIETKHGHRKFRVKTAWEITSGDGQNAFTKNYGGLKYGGRVTFYTNGYFRNFGEFTTHDVSREWSPKFMFGIAGSYNDGQSSRRGRQSGAILYLDSNKQESLPDFIKVGADFLFKYRGFSLFGEAYKTFATVPDDIVYRVRTDGSLSTTFNGGVENYVKGRMMLGTIFNIQAGYVFKNDFALDVRYSLTLADDFSFMNNDQFYNRRNYYTVGVTKYFTQAIKVQLSATYNDHEPGAKDVHGDVLADDVGELTGRILLQFKF